MYSALMMVALSGAASEPACFGCHGGCYGGCYGGCHGGCWGSCGGGCWGSGCWGSCGGGCWGSRGYAYGYGGGYGYASYPSYRYGGYSYSYPATYSTDSTAGYYSSDGTYYYYNSPYYYRDGRFYYNDGRVYGDGVIIDQDRRDRERRDGERMEGERREGGRIEGERREGVRPETVPPGTRQDGTRPAPRPEGTPRPPVPDRSGGDAKPNTQARMILDVPMDSKVFVDGIATKQSFASKRSFVSPPLSLGQNYVYDVKVEIVRGGQTLTETQQVKVRAGEETRAVFNKLLTPASAPVMAWF